MAIDTHSAPVVSGEQAAQPDQEVQEQSSFLLDYTLTKIEQLVARPSGPGEDMIQLAILCGLYENVLSDLAPLLPAAVREKVEAIAAAHDVIAYPYLNGRVK